METILKQHNQIELPREVCRKLELSPGVRFDIEINSQTGVIRLVPITKKLIRAHNGRQKTHPHIFTEPHK